MTPHQFFRALLFSAACMTFIFLANGQTPAQEQQATPQIMAPAADATLRIGGKSALYCAGYIRLQKLGKMPEIVGAEQEQEQRTYSDGNVVYINAGSQQGIKEGQKFQIIRPRGDVKGVHREKEGYLGTYIQEVGQLQVFKVNEDTSAAQITFTCEAALLGDLLAFIPDREAPLAKPVLTYDRFSDPTNKQVGRLMMAKDGREMLSKNDVVYIDLGTEDKLNAGDYLTIFRPLGTGNLTRIDNEESARGRATGFQSDRFRGGGFGIQASRAKDSTAFVDSEGRYRYKPITSKEVKRLRPDMPRKLIGEMVVIDVQARTATAIITQTVLEVHTGDWVEVK